MIEREKFDRFVDWCKGIGLDGSRDYHALQAVGRFEAYEKHIAESARKELITRYGGNGLKDSE